MKRSSSSASIRIWAAPIRVRSESDPSHTDPSQVRIRSESDLCHADPSQIRAGGPEPDWAGLADPSRIGGARRRPLFPAVV